MGKYMNVPDDWHSYWARCRTCGNKYHDSEGGCDCADRKPEEEEEEEEEFSVDATVDGVKYVVAGTRKRCAVTDGDKVVEGLHIETEHDGSILIELGRGAVLPPTGPLDLFPDEVYKALEAALEAVLWQLAAPGEEGGTK